MIEIKDIEKMCDDGEPLSKLLTILIEQSNANEKDVAALTDYKHMHEKRHRHLADWINSIESSLKALEDWKINVMAMLEGSPTYYDFRKDYYESFENRDIILDIDIPSPPAPSEPEKGAWICSECGKDWGDGERPSGHGGYLNNDCVRLFGGCGRQAVKWIPEPEKADAPKTVHMTREEFDAHVGRNLVDENKIVIVDKADAQDELKPCPFCGGKAVSMYDPNTIDNVPHGVECENCWLETRHWQTKAEAKAAWNHRPEEDRLKKKADALDLTSTYCEKCGVGFTHDGGETLCPLCADAQECEDETGTGHIWHEGKCVRCGIPEKADAPDELKPSLDSIITALDNYLGDTDPDIPEDWTDDDIKQEEPLIWIMQQLVKYRPEEDRLKAEIAELRENCESLNKSCDAYEAERDDANYCYEAMVKTVDKLEADLREKDKQIARVKEIAETYIRKLAADPTATGFMKRILAALTEGETGD